MRKLPSPPTAADAVAINALAALLLGAGLDPDVDAELRGLVAEVLPRISWDNPDMTALAGAAGALLAGDADAGARGRLIAGFRLADILRARAFKAWALLQENQGKGQENGEKAG